MGKVEVPIYLDKKDPLVVGKKVFESSYAWNLTEEEIEKARVELGETDEKKNECLQELKDKLSKEGKYRTDDSFLLRYLRVRKFDCDKAYNNIKYYYNMRKKNPHLFEIPTEMMALKVCDFVTCLPYADEEGRILFWKNLENWNPDEYPYDENVRAVAALSDLITMNPKCQVNGVIGIWDSKGLNIRIASEVLKKNRLMTYISIAYFGFPWRIKKILVLNTSRIARFFYSLIKAVVSKKMTERVVLLGSDLSELHQHVNPALLPKALGGALDDEACKNRKFVLDNIPYLEYDRSFTGECA